MKPDKKKRLEAAGWVVSDDPDELFRPKEQAMSKLDELLDWIDGDDYGTPIMLGKEARTELAALRRRAEDAEMMLRGFVSMTITKSGPFGLGGAWLIWDGCLTKPPTILPIGAATGLPILTDEARKAMQ